MRSLSHIASVSDNVAIWCCLLHHEPGWRRDRRVSDGASNLFSIAVELTTRRQGLVQIDKASIPRFSAPSNDVDIFIGNTYVARILSNDERYPTVDG